jgi:hypothetical protein
MALIISVRATTLSILWLAVLLCSLSFALAVVAGLLFRSGRFWRIAIALIIADLLLGVMAALLDRVGYAH